MALEIKNVTNDKQGMKTFKYLPWDIYKNDPTWAPDLLLSLNDRLNKKKHPFYEFGDAEFFLALRDNKVVGRIAGITNSRHVEFRQEAIGFWGFFECENNQETANALFDAAAAWVKSQGFSTMRGPMSCDTQDEIGMVLEGFNQARYFIMPHNPPYYIDLCANYGMEKAKDLLAFRLDLSKEIPPNVVKLAEIAKARMEKRGFVFRALDKGSQKSITADLRKILEIYHEGWKENWGFVPASERQFLDLAQTMQLVADKGLVVMIEGPKDPNTGERPPVAMAVALYDWMETTLWARKFPRWFQLMAQTSNLLYRVYLKTKPKYTRGRLFLAGVMPAFRGQGMDALLYVLPFMAGKERGVLEAELSWELEDNTAIISPIEKMGGQVYKKMRVWDKHI
jgi:hypothetical protein